MVSRNAFVFGVSVSTQPEGVRPGRWFGCLGPSPELLLPRDSRTGWVDPLFGQHAVDLGFKSVVALPGKRNLKVEHCQPAACQTRWKPDYQFPKVQENCGKKSNQANGSPVFPSVVALADRLEDELCGP
jgi:hypothetical protein